MTHEGRERESQNSGEQRSVEGMGQGTWGIQDGHYRDFRKESREFEGGGLTGVEKIEDLDGGR